MPTIFATVNERVHNCQWKILRSFWDSFVGGQCFIGGQFFFHWHMFHRREIRTSKLPTRTQSPQTSPQKVNRSPCILLPSVKSRATKHGNIRRFAVHCSGYFFALVANDGSFESPRPPPSIRMVGRWSGGQLRRQAISLAPSNLRRNSKAPAR